MTNRDKKVDRAIEDAGHKAGASDQRIEDVKEIGHDLNKNGVPADLLAKTADQQFPGTPGAERAQHEAAEQARRDRNRNNGDGDASRR